MIDASSVDDLADRFGEALTGADMETLDQLFAPDFSIYYNFSDGGLDRAQALEFFGNYFGNVSVRFSDISRSPTPTGWVQEHRVDADGPDGFRLRGLPACLVVTTRDGQIARIAEYLDSKQVEGIDLTQLTAG